MTDTDYTAQLEAAAELYQTEEVRPMAEKAQQLDIAEQREVAPPATNAASIMEVISRAASDPQTDVDKLERLMGMYERVQAHQAEAAFNAALAAVQDELPMISERGEIVHSGKVISRYALWEDVNKAIKPVLKRHGLSLAFHTDTSTGHVQVTGVLRHQDGYKDETNITLPADTSGAKNQVQAFASSVSYGKRYVAAALLNLTSGGEDDDAQSAVQPPGPATVDEEQVANLEALISEVGADKANFLRYLKVDSLEELPANKYKGAVAALENKRGQK